MDIDSVSGSKKFLLSGINIKKNIKLNRHHDSYIDFDFVGVLNVAAATTSFNDIQISKTDYIGEIGLGPYFSLQNVN